MAQMTSTIEEISNPLGINGVEFVEFTGANYEYYHSLFTRWGFKQISQYENNSQKKQIFLYRQNDINFIVNLEKNNFAEKFGQEHGPSICSTGFRFKNASFAHKQAIARGAKMYSGSSSDKGACLFDAIYGIGDSLIYFMDEQNTQNLYSQIFKIADNDKIVPGVGFTIVDHFTNNVPVGEMQKWCDFYKQIFNFRETMYFDIRGKQTSLISKVMRSPCGQFAVPINEPGDSKSQIQEYLDEYKGSGIQHLALLTSDIVNSLETLKSSKIEFLSPPPDTYYRMLNDRLPNVKEDIDRLKKNAILVDGDHDGYLLQIFSKNIIGPIFFEVIQRKNHDGFGNGNFQALFDSIEQDQRERGYL